MPNPKKKFFDDVTIVDSNLLNSIYGAVDGYLDPTDPFTAGHLHTGRNDQWGHAPKVDLTNHVTGRLTLPAQELKSIKLSAAQAVPLTSSLFWTLPIPNDGYVAVTQPMFLNIYWSANGAFAPGNVAFRVDWIYIQPGQNVMPPSIIGRGSSAWPANLVSASNPEVTTFRFQSAVLPSVLNVNDSNSPNTGKLIPLSFPISVPGAPLNQFLLLGLEITSAPTVTLTNSMAQVNIFAVELLYASATLGNNQAIDLLPNNPGLSDF